MLYSLIIDDLTGPEVSRDMARKSFDRQLARTGDPDVDGAAEAETWGEDQQIDESAQADAWGPEVGAVA